MTQDIFGESDSFFSIVQNKISELFTQAKAVGFIDYEGFSSFVIPIEFAFSIWAVWSSILFLREIIYQFKKEELQRCSFWKPSIYINFGLVSLIVMYFFTKNSVI